MLRISVFIRQALVKDAEPTPADATTNLINGPPFCDQYAQGLAVERVVRFQPPDC